MHNIATDSTVAVTDGRSQYSRPEVRVICMRVGDILSSSTEGYKNNEPDDWF